ncbi:hypothetical protein C8Q80DRAFT_1209190 [Daedaleopsis nitida]|nr:hypothetical protein C8Q80DRAFT_1209190 [Daedaleopsis nitida]
MGGKSRKASTKPTKTAPVKAAGGQSRGTRAQKKDGGTTPAQASDSEEAGDDHVDWDKDNHALSWSLLTAITDDEIIQNALFPPPGATQSVKNGRGKPKANHHWKLCKTLFLDHAEHGATFQAVVESGDTSLKKKWTTKVKNRLARMVKRVNAAREILGKTGEGIEHASDILDTVPSEFKNKWEEVQAMCPYFFELRALIAQRPNNNPTGIGNTESEIDLTVLGVGSANDAGDTVEADRDAGTGDDDEGAVEELGGRDEVMDRLSGEDESKEGEDSRGRRKRGLTADIVETPAKTSKKPKTPARAGTSTPTTTMTSQSKTKPRKNKGMLDFEAIASAEEKTRQRELDVEFEKIQYNKSKLKLKGNIKLQREQHKFELRRLKLQQQKDLALASLQARSGVQHMQPHSRDTVMGTSLLSVPRQAAEPSHVDHAQAFNPMKAFNLFPDVPASNPGDVGGAAYGGIENGGIGFGDGVAVNIGARGDDILGPNEL